MCLKNDGFSKFNRKLTRYPEGSVRELWTISFPLMLSLMSSSLMYFWDRLLLAHFSLDAHNAAVSASTVALCLQFPFISAATTAEVFVGRIFGSGVERRLARPVWQMCWLALFSTTFFFPLAALATPWFFGDSLLAPLEMAYFRPLIYSSPLFCLNSALSAFYIGRGRIGFAAVTAIVANVINAVLAYFLIFGGGNLFSAQGIGGAAHAIAISQGCQALILAVDFLRQDNRVRFGSGDFRFLPKEFFSCLKLAFPTALAHTLELTAWAFFFKMLAKVGHAHITIASFGQTIFFLFTFITEGISNGATAIASNMIGAQRSDQLWKLFTSGIKFYSIVFVAMGVVLVLHPQPLIDFLLAGDAGQQIDDATYSAIVRACLWVWLFFLFDGVHWFIVGLLTAAGDSYFILKTDGVAFWLFALLPIYLLVVLMESGGDIAWAVMAGYGAIICMIYLHRLYSERWKSIHAIVDGTEICAAH